MTNVIIPGDCIDRVTAQNGERELFERLAMAKPAATARAAAQFTHRRTKSLDKEVSTDSVMKNEAAKEELTDTNTKTTERIQKLNK